MTDWDAVRPYFDRAAVAHVATVMPDGAPHSTPVWAIADGDDLLFFSTAGSRKDANLARDPRIALSVTRPDEPLDMAFVRGAVRRRLEGDEAMAIVDRIAEAYTGGPYDVREGLAAFVVRPTTWRVQDYSAA